MKALFLTWACIGAIFVTLSLTGCGLEPSHSGRQCTVQFRRDVLGAARDLPVSPMVQGVNGAETSVSGSYKSMSDEWVVIERSGKDVWIAKSTILLIEFGK